MPALIRTVRRTVLIVSGRPAEATFLAYLRSLYSPTDGSIGIVLRCAYSDDGAAIVGCASRLSRNAQYDCRLALIGSGAASSRVVKAAAKSRLSLVVPEPCFEGLLLDLLGLRGSDDVAACRHALGHESGLDWTEIESYKNSIIKDALALRAKQIVSVNGLIQAMSAGRWPETL